MRGCVVIPFMARETSPRTDYAMLKINHLVVRPERVEGRMANYDTVSRWGRIQVGGRSQRFTPIPPFPHHKGEGDEIRNSQVNI